MATKTVTNKKTSFDADTNNDYAVDTNAGIASDGTQRVVLASDQSAIPVTGTFYQATQPVSAAALPLPALAATSTKQSDGTQKSQIVDGSGNVIASTSNALNVAIVSGAGSGGTAMTDDAAFTVGTTSITPIGGTYKSVRDAVDDNDGGALAMTPKRGLYVTLETPLADSVMDDTNDCVKTSVVAALPAGTNNIGDVDVLSSALPTGASTEATLSSLNGKVTACDTGAVTISAALPTGANTIGSVKLTDGTTTATVRDLASNDALNVAIVDASGNQVTSFGGSGTADLTIAPASVTSATTIFTQDCAGYTHIAVQVTSAGTTCTITYEQSTDNVTFLACSGNDIVATTGVPVSTSNTVGIRQFAIAARYFRARVSTFTSGTVTAGAYLKAQAPTPLGGYGVQAVIASGTVTTLTNWGNVVDNAAFVDGTTRLSPSGYIYDEVAGTALTENDAAAARINVNRAQVQVFEDGVTRGRYATVTASNALKVEAGGDVAHDAVDSGNPVKIGYKAKSSPKGLTLVADGDRTDAYADIDGIQITKLNTAGGDTISERVSNTDGASTAFANFTAVASTKNYITAFNVFRTDAGTTPIYVDFRDGTAGAILWSAVIPPNGGANNPPYCGPCLFKTSANTALAFDVSAATTTVYISASGYQSKV